MSLGFPSAYGDLLSAWRDGVKRETGRSAAAFLILMVLTCVGCLLIPGLLDLLSGVMGNLTVDLDAVTDESGILSALAVFVSNLQATTFIMLYGLLPFVQLPAMALGLNAVLLGWLAAVYVRNGLSLALYLAALIPHAIFELPAMMLAFGVGLYTCGQLTRRLRGNEETRSVTGCLSLMGQTLLLALAPLLLAAAFVEAYVTPAIAAWFL